MIQIKLVVTSMIFQCTELHMSKCNGSCVLSIKFNMYLNIQPPAMFVLLVFPKSGIIKSCLSIQDLSAYKIPWSYVDWCKFYIHPSSLKYPSSPDSKGPYRKIIVSTKLVDMSAIVHCAKLRMSLSVTVYEVSPKKKKVKFQPPAMFVLLVFHKNSLTKSCSSSEDLS
jgi:hypothetical protein